MGIGKKRSITTTLWRGTRIKERGLDGHESPGGTARMTHDK